VVEASKGTKELGLHQAYQTNKQTNKQDVPIGDKAEKYCVFCSDSQSKILVYFSYQE